MTLFLLETDAGCRQLNLQRCFFSAPSFSMLCNLVVQYPVCILRSCICPSCTFLPTLSDTHGGGRVCVNNASWLTHFVFGDAGSGRRLPFEQNSARSDNSRAELLHHVRMNCTIHQHRCALFILACETIDTIRYDTIRDAILTCARKPTRLSLIYRMETTTKKCKNRKTKK